jgi:hypothetical protein
MALGECNCGAVAFEIDTELSGVFVCHCSICRKYTGSNGIAVVVVDNNAFRWLRGEEQIASWKKPGADWQSWFCCVCGSPLPGANDTSQTFVPAGLISEGGEGLRIAHHIWVGSKAVWDVSHPAAASICPSTIRYRGTAERWPRVPGQHHIDTTDGMNKGQLRRVSTD